MSASGSTSDILSLGFEDKLLISSVYQRAQRFDLGCDPSEASSNGIYDGSGTMEQSLQALTHKADPSMQRSAMIIQKPSASSIASRMGLATEQHAFKVFDGTSRHQSFPGPKINRTNPTEVKGQPDLIPIEAQTSRVIPYRYSMSVPVHGRDLPTTVDQPNLNYTSHSQRCILSLGEPSDFFLQDSTHKVAQTEMGLPVAMANYSYSTRSSTK